MPLARSVGLQMSARTPGELNSGAATKVPARKRPTSRAPKVGAQAQRMLKAM